MSSCIQISDKHQMMSSAENDLSASLAASRSCVNAPAADIKEKAEVREIRAEPLKSEVPALGLCYFAYIAPYHEAGTFPGQEIHCGFITNADKRQSQLELQGALRYSKFSATFHAVDGDEWNRFRSLVAPFDRCEIGPKMYSMVLPNQIYGRVFDRLFAKNLNPSFTAAVDELRDALAENTTSFYWSWSCRIL
jgi:hypothetical protein